MGKMSKRIRRANGKAKANGVSKSKAPSVLDLPPGSRIELLADEQKKLSELRNRMNQLKFALADSELTRVQILKALVEANEQVVVASKEIARAHGLDPEADPKLHGQWQFNLDELTLIRQT